MKPALLAAVAAVALTVSANAADDPDLLRYPAPELHPQNAGCISYACVGDDVKALDIACHSVADLYHTDKRLDDTLEEMERRERKFGCMDINGKYLRLTEIYQDTDHVCGLDDSSVKWCLISEAVQVMAPTNPSATKRACNTVQSGMQTNSVCTGDKVSLLGVACPQVTDIRDAQDRQLRMSQSGEANTDDPKANIDAYDANLAKFGCVFADGKIEIAATSIITDNQGQRYVCGVTGINSRQWCSNIEIVDKAQ
jgi:hypothetical protein